MKKIEKNYYYRNKTIDVYNLANYVELENKLKALEEKLKRNDSEKH